MHIHHLVVLPTENISVTRWPTANISSIRLWDSRTRWADLERTRGKWQFATLDTYIQQATAHGVEVLYTLGSTPKWASARPEEWCPYGISGCSAEPRSMADWENYARVVARRYKGRIQFYELWNEPHFTNFARDRTGPAFFTGNVRTMVEMARIAKSVLKEEDENAKLLTPGFVNGPDRLDLFLRSGGKQYVDAIAYHFYAATPEKMMVEVKQVQQVMANNGVGHLPLWNTEQGWEVHDKTKPLPPGVFVRLSERVAAAYTAQSLALAAAGGIDRFFYYSWDSGNTGLIELKSGLLNKQGFAYQQALRWLRDTQIGECTVENLNVMVCPLHRNDRKAWIVWSKSGALKFDIPESWGVVQYEKLNGGVVGAQPNALIPGIQIDIEPTLLKADKALWSSSTSNP